MRDPVALVILAPRPEATRALRHGRPLSPRLSLAPRDGVQLVATYCDVGHGPAGEQVLEKTVDGGDR